MGVEILALSSIALTAASTGLAMYGQHQQAKSQTQAAKYNNDLAQAEAVNLQNQSREAQTRERQRNRRHMATIRANLAHQGTASGSGTPLAILGESQQNFSLGIADAARATDMQANSLRAQGQMGLWEAKNFSRATRINQVSTLIGGTTRAVSAYQGFKYQGAL